MTQTPAPISTSTTTENTAQTTAAPVAEPTLNTHFVLAVTAICVSCLTGFFSIPLALAALIFSLRAQDQLSQNQLQQARQSAFWAAIFGWITLAFLLLPIMLILLFGSAILTALGIAAAA